MDEEELGCLVLEQAIKLLGIRLKNLGEWAVTARAFDLLFDNCVKKCKDVIDRGGEPLESD